MIGLEQMYPGAYPRPTAKTGGLPSFRPSAKTGSGYALGTSGLPAPPPGAAPIPMAPPAPAQSYMQQMGAAPGMGTQSAPAPVQPMGGQTPQVPNSLGMFHLGQSTQKPYSDPFGDLDPDHRKQLDEYFNSLAGIDYKGSHESALMQRAMLAQLMRGWEGEGEVDTSGQAQIGQYFDRSRSRQAAQDAAMGRSGGVAGAAQASLYGSQGNAIAEYLRQMYGQRQQQHHDDYQRFLQNAWGMNKAGLDQNIAEQNSGGFWDDLLGVGGSLVGGLVGGPVGMGVGGAIGGALGGHSKTPPANPTYGRINDDPWGLG